MQSDADLLRQYAHQHCESAFAELVRRHLAFVYNAALRRVNGNIQLAEEATQLVFVQLARKAESVAGHPAIVGWLHTSTRYATSTLVRRETRRIAREQCAAMSLDPSTPPAPDWETIRPLIDDALDRLNEVDRRAILLRYFSGHSFAQIGVELQASEDASRKRIERAIENLRRQFARRGVTTTASALAVALANAPAVAVTESLVVSVTAAATSASVPAAAALFGFMSTIKIAMSAAASVAFITIAGIAVVFESREQDRQEQQLEATRAQLAATRVRLLELGHEAKSAASTAKAQTSAKRATGAPRLANDAFENDQLSGARIVFQSAEFAPVRLREYRLQVQHDYGSFFASRNYSVATATMVREALAKFYAHYAEDTLAFSSAVPGTVRSPNMGADFEPILADLKPALGDEEAEALRRCFSAQRFLGEAHEAGLELADGGVPLSRTQEMALAMVISDRNIGTTSAKEQQLPVDPKSGLNALDQAKLEDAAVFLTPVQMERFENYLREERARETLTARARAIAEASP
jgi:RNA polymerase sigma factor (sigma-70 family)